MAPLRAFGLGITNSSFERPLSLAVYISFFVIIAGGGDAWSFVNASYRLSFHHLFSFFVLVVVFCAPVDHRNTHSRYLSLLCPPPLLFCCAQRRSMQAMPREDEEDDRNSR
jgi:hypothetical protein